MIKLFRNIRQNLLNAGKTSRYFKYAIGEIILVVIGILIALQINTWNEGRKNRIEEQFLLTQLESEFQSNLKQLDEKIAIRNRMIHASLKLFEYIDRPEQRNTDSITKYITHTMEAPTFDPIVNDLISSGKLQLLRNNRLKQLLSLWTSEIVQVTEDEINWRDFHKDVYEPFLREHISLRNIFQNYWQTNQVVQILIDRDADYSFNFSKSKQPDNLSGLLDQLNFEDNLANCITWNKLVNIQSETLRKRILEILNLIQDQLNENQ